MFAISAEFGSKHGLLCAHLCSSTDCLKMPGCRSSSKTAFGRRPVRGFCWTSMIVANV